jgi:hypothetical protein
MSGDLLEGLSNKIDRLALKRRRGDADFIGRRLKNIFFINSPKIWSCPA